MLIRGSPLRGGIGWTPIYYRKKTSDGCLCFPPSLSPSPVPSSFLIVWVRFPIVQADPEVTMQLWMTSNFCFCLHSPNAGFAGVHCRAVLGIGPRALCTLSKQSTSWATFPDHGLFLELENIKHLLPRPFILWLSTRDLISWYIYFLMWNLLSPRNSCVKITASTAVVQFPIINS